jgi:Ca-activated chloride channel family protein
MTPPPRRSPILVGAALALAVLLTGCGSGADGGDASAPVAPGPDGGGLSVPPSTPAPAPENQGAGESTSQDRPAQVHRDLSLTDPQQDPFSTFALDIDTGSYTRFRDAVRNGYRPSPSEVRTEEFVNYFEQDYPTPADGLGLTIDAAVLPFRPDHRLVRVGIRSADVRADQRRDADLVLVVDCSGSMSEAGKMETTKTALRTLAANLRPSDRVAMVCYSDTAEVTLQPTWAADRSRVLDAIEALRPTASTNAEAGLTAGYDLAATMRAGGAGEGRMTRVVLVSDGVANVGDTTAGGILERIGAETRYGVNLVSVGVGISGYNDQLLEQVADRGDGWHVYVDTTAEAERVFATGLTGSLVVTARDAKAQVQFDPDRVAGYRLIGYENRAVADQDFRNDAVDGGEVTAGHATTALYDVQLREGAGRGDAFVTATVRYRDESDRTVERRAWLADGECAADLGAASPRLHQDLVVAMLTDQLTRGPWSQWVSPEEVRSEAYRLPGVLREDPDVAELVSLVDRAVA